MNPKIKEFILNKKNLIIFGIAVVLVAGGLMTFFVLRGKPSETVVTPSVEDQVFVVEQMAVCQNPRKLDGMCVEAGKDNLPVYGVMIENAVDARPQQGLAKANMVFEALAEGGITRFLVLYDQSVDLKKIAPVRSARTYFLEWAQEFGALYAHIGGSPESLELARVRPIYDLDQFFNASYFWRSSDRIAPHNVYTSMELLNKAVLEKKWEIKPNYESWLFKDDAKISDRGATQSINVDFSSYYYSIKWEYNPTTNEYTRYQGGSIHKDEDGSVIKTKNIAVMYTTSYVIPNDDKGRRFTQTVGHGKAYVYFDGKEIIGTWKRENLNSRTRFYDADGHEIIFNRGTTWVEVLPKDFSAPKVTFAK